MPTRYRYKNMLLQYNLLKVECNENSGVIKITDIFDKDICISCEEAVWLSKVLKIFEEEE